MKGKLIAVAATLIVALAAFPDLGHADHNRVCRASPFYLGEIKKAAVKKLTDAGIQFSSVQAAVSMRNRSRDIYINDFADNLTINGTENPSILFAGAFPDRALCDVTARLRITVKYPNGQKAISVTPISVPGVMLSPREVQ